MDVVDCCVDKPLFTYNILLTIIYAMIVLMSENTHNIPIRGDAMMILMSENTHNMPIRGEQM